MTQRLKEQFKESINSEDKQKIFEKINKIDKLNRFIKKKESPNKIRNDIGEVTTNTIEIQKIVRNYYKQLYAK